VFLRVRGTWRVVRCVVVGTAVDRARKRGRTERIEENIKKVA